MDALNIIISNERHRASIFLHLLQKGALPLGEPLVLNWIDADGCLIARTAGKALDCFVYDDIADASGGLLQLWTGTPAAPRLRDEMATYFSMTGIDPLKPLAFYIIQHQEYVAATTKEAA